MCVNFLKSPLEKFSGLFILQIHQQLYFEAAAIAVVIINFNSTLTNSPQQSVVSCGRIITVKIETLKKQNRSSVADTLKRQIMCHRLYTRPEWNHMNPHINFTDPVIRATRRFNFLMLRQTPSQNIYFVCNPRL